MPLVTAIKRLQKCYKNIADNMRFKNIHPVVYLLIILLLTIVIYSNSIQNGFSNLPLSLKEASYTLGKSRLTTIFRVLLPNIKPALLTGVCLTFAHTIGEFGVILMIGGNIPGKTRVAALAVYDEVQALNFDMANRYAIFLFLFSFVVLLFIYSINREYLRWKRF